MSLLSSQKGLSEDCWHRMTLNEPGGRMRKSTAGMHVVLIILFLLLPPAIYLTPIWLKYGSLPQVPGFSAQIAIASTTASVGITALAIFFAAIALILSIKEPRGTERAVGFVMRAPQSLFTSISLIGGISLSVLNLALLREPSQFVWNTVSVFNLLSGSLIMSGILGTTWWFWSLRVIFSTEAILGHFFKLIPTNWTFLANREAERLWHEAIEEQTPRRKRLSFTPLDSNALGLSTDDPVVFSIDALSGWITSSSGRPIAGSVEPLLYGLTPKLVSANSILAERVLPTHLVQVLVASINSNDPKMIRTIVEWMADLHQEWEKKGLGSVRINHFNWLMPILSEWLVKRGLDYTSEPILDITFQLAAEREKLEGRRDAMLVAFIHFIRLMRRLLEADQVWAAELVWSKIDLYLRQAGSIAPAGLLVEIIKLAKLAGDRNIRAFDDSQNGGMGGFRDWICIGLGHSIDAALSRAEESGDEGLASQERYFACKVAQALKDLFSQTNPPTWNGDPVDSLQLQIKRGLQVCSYVSLNEIGL